jgi:ketosteroid isomerase-like protein
MMPSDSLATLERLRNAINRHDLDAFVACFAPDYQSEQPAHPMRAFTGSGQVRQNWAAFFAGVPDLQAEVVRATTQGETVWVEWHWHGTRQDGTALDMRGVTLFGVRDDRLIWGRLYMGETDAGGADIDATMARLAGQQPESR